MLRYFLLDSTGDGCSSTSTISTIYVHAEFSFFFEELALTFHLQGLNRLGSSYNDESRCTAAKTGRIFHPRGMSYPSFFDRERDNTVIMKAEKRSVNHVVFALQVCVIEFRVTSLLIRLELVKGTIVVHISDDLPVEEPDHVPEPQCLVYDLHNTKRNYQ